jgi:hypothetical protein
MFRQLEDLREAQLRQAEAERLLKEAVDRQAEIDRQNAARPPAPPAPPSPTPTPTGGGRVTVGGIVVDASIGDELAALLAAAKADGITLSGGGYRDPAAQRRLRQQNCPDPVNSPASACSPPTAKPGTSMHEQGLAIDFTYNGSLIESRSSPGFKWLAANAERYGFFNLPSEAWHWSVNGN